MNRLMLVLLIVLVGIGVGRTAYQATTPPEVALSKYVPSGAVLYLQAKDFSSVLADWKRSPQKQEWLRSANYEVFSRSRLLLRLREAGKQFASAAGLPPDMNFLTQVAGTQSALALYDIGRLQFLYVTRLPSTNSMQSQLWQGRTKFEARSAGGTTFYLRRESESEREVEFAITGNYLLLSTREDLMTGALQLIAGAKAPTIEGEPWWSQSVASARDVGDVRMVLNLEKIAPSSYFRSYWVQQNITDMKEYSAAVSDLFRSGEEYREERVLLRKVAAGTTSDVADLVRLVPEGAGVYEAKPCPSSDACFEVMETKILAPHFGPAPTEPLAPQVQLTSGETGSSSDLETRIDQAPAQHAPDGQGKAALKAMLQKNQVHAVLQVQSTSRDRDGVFVRIHSAVALVGGSDWDEGAIRSALTSFVRSSLTASQLGVGWRQTNGYSEFDGLRPLMTAVRGRYLIVSDDPGLISAMLSNLGRKSDLKPAAFAAGFNHKDERDNFSRFAEVVDRPDRTSGGTPGTGQEPQFFSENIASLSSTLAAVSSEKIVVRDVGDRVLQTVTYRWSH
jgi:hypothetical protein